MKIITALFTALCVLFLVSCNQKPKNFVTVPFTLDHNRMLVEGEIQKSDSSWQKAIFWVDMGNPSFLMSQTLADKIGEQNASLHVRIGGKLLDFSNIKPKVKPKTFGLFLAMNFDANLPSSVLKNYQIVFDYPNMQLSIGDSGSIAHRGVKTDAQIQSTTGIVQINTSIENENYSFAIDNGASYSFFSDSIVAHFLSKNPKLQYFTGCTGYANMWGFWPPDEQNFKLIKLNKIAAGSVNLTNIGIVGVTKSSMNGISLGNWYSQKTVNPVEGFLGANALKDFCVEIDYKNNAMYFEKGTQHLPNDMCMVGLTICPQGDSTYIITGISKVNDKLAVEGINVGDKLIEIDNLIVKGKTMGVVIEALRGKSGDIHNITVESNGQIKTVSAKVAQLF